MMLFNQEEVPLEDPLFLIHIIYNADPILRPLWVPV